jgi:hypothetical protein
MPLLRERGIPLQARNRLRGPTIEVVAQRQSARVSIGA